MFRHLVMAIFRLCMEYLVRSYRGILWDVYSGIVQELRWAQNLVCVMEFGKCKYMGFLLLNIMSKLI